MIDVEQRKKYYQCYQHIIDEVSIEECIAVAVSIPLHCNREEMIREKIIQILAEQLKGAGE